MIFELEPDEARRALSRYLEDEMVPATKGDVVRVLHPEHPELGANALEYRFEPSHEEGDDGERGT